MFLARSQWLAAVFAAAPHPLACLFMRPNQMGPEWVERHGCAEQVPPSARSLDRPFMLVLDICTACAIPLPASFVNEPHVGGDSCPFCNWIAAESGQPVSWFWHPKDENAPMGPDGRPASALVPAGHEKRYQHQVFKCQLGWAIVHFFVRQDRNAGLGEVRAHLFAERPLQRRG